MGRGGEGQARVCKESVKAKEDTLGTAWLACPTVGTYCQAWVGMGSCSAESGGLWGSLMKKPAQQALG